MKNQKKEKGTNNSTPDSVKNQVKYNENHLKFKENSVILINRLLSDLSRGKDHLTDEYQIRRYESYLKQLNQIKRSVLIDPRYPHQIVQNIIDYMYSLDNQIKGVSVPFLFSDIKNNLENFNPDARAIF